jgi:putative membrane protein
VSEGVDYRFSLSNERTYLAWVRTALGLIAGGVVAAKALGLDHDVWRWIVSLPPFAAGAATAGLASRRRRAYERAMEAGRALPASAWPERLAWGLALYACVLAAVLLLDL